MSTTATDRIKRLKEFDNESTAAFQSQGDFIKWQGVVSGLLGSSPVIQSQFDYQCGKFIHTHNFNGNSMDESSIKEMTMIQALVSRAISVLEVNQSDSEKGAMLETTQALITSQKKQPLRTIANTPKQPVCLTNEEGLQWFYHHCHYSVRWKLIGLMLSIIASTFAVGFMAGQIRFFQQAWDLIKQILPDVLAIVR